MWKRAVAGDRQTGGRGRFRFGWIVGAVLAVGGTAALTAWAQHGPEGMGPPHGGPGGWGGGMMAIGGPPEHAARMADSFLDGLHATDAQRAQIKQIVQAAATDLQKQQRDERAIHEKTLAVFTAPTVDAGAAETLRAQMQAAHDQGSRRMLQALLDVSRVLTPEQRAKIGARMQERAAVMEDRMQRMRLEHEQHGPGHREHGGHDDHNDHPRS